MTEMLQHKKEIKRLNEKISHLTTDQRNEVRQEQTEISGNDGIFVHPFFLFYLPACVFSFKKIRSEVSNEIL